MARRRIWFGSIGPYLYDDTKHPAGVFCEGRMKCGQGPIDDDDVARKQDIKDDHDLLIVETQSVEVVTEVDFETEEVTTETVTYVSDVYFDSE